MTDILAWNDAFLLGVPDIDADHRRLVDYINRLNALLRDGAGHAEFAPLLGDLSGHLRAHFAREEALFGHLDASQSEHHRRSHRDVIDRLSGMARAGDFDPEAVVAFLHQPQWFDASSARIDRLKAVEDKLGAAILASADRLHDENLRAFLLLALTGGLLVASTVAVAALLVRSINGPLDSLVVSLDRLASGDTAVRVFGLHKRDTIGRIARAVDGFKHHIIRSGMAQAKTGIDQSVRERRSLERERATERFQADLDALIDAMAGNARSLEGSAAELSAAMDGGRARAASVAAAATQATANVGAVAAAVEELAASIREISGQTDQSARVAGEARQGAEGARATVGGLADAAQRIGEVVEIIRGIASQTNLLALNATIEAARAGEAGKGFAVVAGEVKSLANQTAAATDDIRGQVEAIQAETARAVEAIGRIGTIVGSMSEAVTAVAAAVEEQDATTTEIGRNVAQAAGGDPRRLREHRGRRPHHRRGGRDGRQRRPRRGRGLGRGGQPARPGARLRRGDGPFLRRRGAAAGWRRGASAPRSRSGALRPTVR